MNPIIIKLTNKEWDYMSKRYILNKKAYRLTTGGINFDTLLGDIRDLNENKELHIKI